MGKTTRAKRATKPAKQPKSKAPAESTATEPAKPAPDAIPKDLADKWGAVQAIATVHTCLNKGLFTHDYMTVVKGSLLFVAKLHEQTVEDALNHPQADMIPELKALKEGEQKNGEGKETASPEKTEDSGVAASEDAAGGDRALQ